MSNSSTKAILFLIIGIIILILGFYFFYLGFYYLRMASIMEAFEANQMGSSGMAEHYYAMARICFIIGVILFIFGIISIILSIYFFVRSPKISYQHQTVALRTATQPSLVRNTPNFCQYCGKSLKPEWNVCPNCGKRFEQLVT